MISVDKFLSIITTPTREVSVDHDEHSAVVVEYEEAGEISPPMNFEDVDDNEVHASGWDLPVVEFRRDRKVTSND